MIGQTIGALSSSPSKSVPVSVPGTDRPAAVTPVLNSSSSTCSSTQLAPRLSLPTSSPQPVVPSFTMICQPATSAASSAPTVGDDLGATQRRPLNACPAQVPTAVQSTPALTSPSTSLPSHMSGTLMDTSLFSQPTPSKTQMSASPNLAAATNTQLSTTSTGTIQQRIVINTSAPLAGGTQILLNNARFVVPPQGLGPGSHVLIISSPAAQQVPPTCTTSTGLPVPPQRTTHDHTAPQSPLSPHPPVRLSTAPAASYPFVACAPTVAPSSRATAADVRPVQLPCVASAVLPVKTNENFAPPTVGTPTLVSFPPRVGAPGLMSSVAHRVPGTVATPAQAECSPFVAHSLSRMSAPVSSLPVVGGPLIPTSSVITRAPTLLPPLLAQGVASVTTAGPVAQPQQRGAASSIHPPSHGPLHSRLDNTSVTNLGPALIQTVLAGANTQVSPAAAIPSIAGGASRIQTLPVATVPPIGSIVHTFETTQMAVARSSNSAVLMTSAQPIGAFKIDNPSDTALTDEALGKGSPDTSSKGNVASRLLIRPDGAVLNVLQRQASTAELAACSRTKDSRVVFHNSSTGELRTHDSELQPSPAGRS